MTEEVVRQVTESAKDILRTKEDVFSKHILAYISFLEKENAALKAQIESPCTSCCLTETLEQSLDEMNYQIVNQDAEIRQLKEQIEKMKCCGNSTMRRFNMLVFQLKKEWYEKIKNGEKTVEYREVKDYWTKRIKNVVQELNLGEKPKCYFQLGYNPDTKLKATILKVERVDGKNTDLKIDKPVYAIHFKLEK